MTFAPPPNRATQLTPPGVGAIAVIRIQGPLVPTFLQTHFTRPARQNACVHGDVLDHDRRVIDDAVVVLDAPDSAELNIHGGAWVTRDVLDLLRRSGFEIVKPSPAELWAVEGDSTLQREVNAWLPAARTELALRSLVSQEQAWCDLVATRPPPAQLQQILADRSLDHLLTPPRVAIVGVPNVGKSTLANQLFGSERSITADLPGTTRDWVGELANLDGLVVQLVDTPGLRDTPDPIEREAIARSAPVVSAADLVLLVLDVTQPLDLQTPLLERFPAAIRAVNKTDRQGGWNPDPLGPHCPLVATTGAGVDALRASVRAHFGVRDDQHSAPRCFTDRQRQIFREALTRPEALSQILR